MDNNTRKYIEDEDCPVQTKCSGADPTNANADDHHNQSSTNASKKYKSELQLLMLSSEAQEYVMNTLKSIHGENFKLGDNSKYKNSRESALKPYWEDRGHLIIQSISSNFASNDNKKLNSNVDTDDRLRKYAITKLESYGFPQNHCIEALDYCSNNINDALELLFSKYMKHNEVDKLSNTNAETNSEYTENELLEMREDERQVLESIYDKAFEEKEKNSVWSVKLEINYLLEYSISESKKLKKAAEEAKKMKVPQGKKKVKCRNLAKGSCKYGEKCRFSHEIEEKKKPKKYDDHLKKEFFLEIRFPKNSRYPYEAPTIFLKTTCHDISPKIILQIDRKLYKEAQQLAFDGMPSIYTISEFLQIHENITKFLSEDVDNFPNPNKSLFHVEDENLKSKSDETEKILPSHYRKGTTGHLDRPNLTTEQILNDDKMIAKKFMEKCKNRDYQNMLKARKNLPAWNKMTEILNTIENNQVIVISGETGCGKSTQVPQFILDNWLLETATATVTDTTNNIKNCSNSETTTISIRQQHIEIICTQPRRLSAIGVAERVANERIERIGNTIGYQIRLENKISVQTRLTFCTIGILIQRLYADPYLKSISHIIIDEVHERSEESDFLLVILKTVLAKRKDLKIILMSATINADLFSKYFGSVPVLEIPGRTYPVQQYFLEDILDRTKFVLEQNSQYCRKLNKKEQDNLENADIEAQLPSNTIKDESLNLAAINTRYKEYSMHTCRTIYLMNPMKINPELIEAVLSYIIYNIELDWPKKGTILIFLPGFAEIQAVYEALCDSSEFGPRNNKYIIVPLHSTLSNEEQSKIFEKVPKNQRRIVLSTNIAETSITIDDCVYVIDCGQMKEKHFDPGRGIESLDLVWESKANALQRKGRAGRCMPGICIHLFTSNRYKYHFISQPIPEILRIPLERFVLRIKSLPIFEGFDLSDVANQIIEPPKLFNISMAITSLENIGAIDKEEELTALGYHLSVLPVDVRIGKLILFGAIFQCLDNCLTIAACLSHKSPFLSPFNKKLLAEQKKRSFAVHNSDHLTILNAYKKWSEVNKKSKYGGRCYANENLLSWKTLVSISEVKYQFLESLVGIGFVPVDLPRKRKNMEDRILELTGSELNCNGDNNRLLIALLCAALYPNIVKIFTPEKNYIMTAGGAIPQDLKSTDIRFKTNNDGYVSIHPSSVNSNLMKFHSPFLIYQEKIKTYKIFVKECSIISALSLLFFSGNNFEIQLHDDKFLILLNGEWIVFKSQSLQVAEMLQYLKIDLLKLLEEKLNDPLLNLFNHKDHKKIISTIIYLISRE